MHRMNAILHEIPLCWGKVTCLTIALILYIHRGYLQFDLISTLTVVHPDLISLYYYIIWKKERRKWERIKWKKFFISLVSREKADQQTISFLDVTSPDKNIWFWNKVKRNRPRIQTSQLCFCHPNSVDTPYLTQVTRNWTSGHL